MAGHSQFKNIQHRKGAQDKRKAKIFTKCLKEISVAVKTGGGGGNPDLNPRLRAAMINARSVNIPRDTIERAIKKALGGDEADLMETTLECYGPEGVAVFIECSTDNNTRTVAAIRSYFNKYGGSIGKDGCLQFVFERKAVFTFLIDGHNVDDLTLELIDANAEDVELNEGRVTVTSSMENFGALQKKLDELKIECENSGLQRLPLTTKSISPDSYRTILKLFDVLEEDDDVSNFYHNIEFTEELGAIEL
jgi:YebC/PmpR family DNA-binding regulatory protein